MTGSGVVTNKLHESKVL